MHWNWNDGWSGWNWALMTVGMLAFWGLVSWAIITGVRSGGRADRVARQSAEEILAARLESGEIDGKEYQRRLDLVRSSRAHPSSDAGSAGLPAARDRPSDQSST